MTELLEQAFAEASKLPLEEQDRFATLMLEELDSERRWAEAFASSGDILDKLADEALAEKQAGRTKVLDPDRLFDLEV
jgi:hypothetical protein